MDHSTSPSHTTVQAPRPLRAPANGLDKRETSQYIADMVLELRNLAKHHNLLALQGLLEVAYYEAFGVAAQTEIPPGEVEHIKELSRASAG